LMTRNVAIRVSIAIALILISLFTNRAFLGWGLFAVLAVLVVPFGRARSLLAAFVPYAMVWFVFTFLRSLADETRWSMIVNTRVAKLERWIFNGELPSIRLQADYYTPGQLHWYDYYFTFVHWSYFIIPHAVAVFLWWKYFPLFRRYLISLTLLLTMGLGLYFLLPSDPPWMAPDRENSPFATVHRVMEDIGEQLGGGLYQAGYSVVGESNPIAAMPSIHFAVTFLLVMTSYSFSKRWQIAAWVYAISMGLALVYMGEHYVVDVLAGGAITATSWYLAGVWLRSGRSLVPAWRRGEEVVPVGQYPDPAT
jgi:membrane-associated phospholipid phosphatase